MFIFKKDLHRAWLDLELERLLNEFWVTTFFLMIGKLSSGLRGLFSKRKISMLVVEVIIWRNDMNISFEYKNNKGSRHLNCIPYLHLFTSKNG
jgi:hypothetical protein